MILLDLCSAAGLSCPAGAEQIAVSGICTSSCEVTAGQLFVALRGERADGHHYLTDARSVKLCICEAHADDGDSDHYGCYTDKLADGILS
ncbi:MAG: hypothetical protein IKZ16_00035, partial [Clostridia bacterium]|nr:hypothetical protein [Clostridia bacterium]